MFHFVEEVCRYLCLQLLLLFAAFSLVCLFPVVAAVCLYIWLAVGWNISLAANYRKTVSLFFFGKNSLKYNKSKGNQGNNTVQIHVAYLGFKTYVWGSGWENV